VRKYPEPKRENGRIVCPKCSANCADRGGYRYHYNVNHGEPREDPVEEKQSDILKEFGITKKELKRILVSQKTPKVASKQIEIGETYKFAAIADTHLCSKEEKMSELHAFYDICKEEGITDVYHAGDILAGQGVYRGQEYEIHTFGADNQVNYCVKNYPKVKGITTHFILGNHDYIYYKQIGLDVGKMIAQEREDMNYLGLFEANINIGGINLIRLIHPDGGMAYAMSYRMQKYVEQISSGKKPRIIISGHQHTALWFLYRNVYVVQAGAFEGQTTLILRKGINPSIGGYIITVKLAKDSKRSIVSFLPDFRQMSH
jgi:predicted phosphodiesterase